MNNITDVYSYSLDNLQQVLSQAYTQRLITPDFYSHFQAVIPVLKKAPAKHAYHLFFVFTLVKNLQSNYHTSLSDSKFSLFVDYFNKAIATQNLIHNIGQQAISDGDKSILALFKFDICKYLLVNALEPLFKSAKSRKSFIESLNNKSYLNRVFAGYHESLNIEYLIKQVELNLNNSTLQNAFKQYFKYLKDNGAKKLQILLEGTHDFKQLVGVESAKNTRGNKDTKLDYQQAEDLVYSQLLKDFVGLVKNPHHAFELVRDMFVRVLWQIDNTSIDLATLDNQTLSNLFNKQFTSLIQLVKKELTYIKEIEPYKLNNVLETIYSKAVVELVQTIEKHLTHTDLLEFIGKQY